MDLSTQLFGGLLTLIYHASTASSYTATSAGLSQPARVVSGEILSQRTADYQNWVETFARNHRIPIEWAEKGVRKEDHVLPWQRRMVRAENYGVYCILKSMEQGRTFRVTAPRIPHQGRQ